MVHERTASVSSAHHALQDIGAASAPPTVLNGPKWAGDIIHGLVPRLID